MKKKRAPSTSPADLKMPPSSVLASSSMSSSPSWRMFLATVTVEPPWPILTTAPAPAAFMRPSWTFTSASSGL